MVSRLFEKIRSYGTSARADKKIKEYLDSGRKPWTLGYSEHKKKLLYDVLRDQGLLECFRQNKVLPSQYGFRIDERVIEYPWVLSRLGVTKRLLLDAGSVLNYQYILDLPVLKCRTIVIYNLSPQNVVKRRNICYICGDLRHTSLDSQCFDEIVCISTLEHVGMNNTFLYSRDPNLNEFKPDDYQDVVKEFRRLLKPSGRLFITVPYGRFENLGWLQQFDQKRIENIIKVFGGSVDSEAYYKYFADGWQLTDMDTCVNCSYFDIHNRADYETDYVAAARAIVCIEMVKQ